MVLLHGFSTSVAASWAASGWIDVLVERGFRVLALDFPGHGRSAGVRTQAECTTPALADDVVAILDRAGVERAGVFGFSMGGGVALQLAMEHPDRVERLVVGGVGDAAIDRLHDPVEVAAVADALAGHGRGAARMRRVAERAGNDARVLLPFLHRGGWPGGLADLHQPAAPLLVIVAENDEYMRETGELLKRLPAAEVLDVPGRGHHDVLLDDAVRDRVIAFLLSE